MSKPVVASTLYHLIEAGLLARQAVLAPLVERGLQAGDDAVLFALEAEPRDRLGLVVSLGGETNALDQRLDRLIGRGLVAPHAIGPELVPGLALTERGVRTRAQIERHWRRLEAELLAGIEGKRRRRFGRVLKRILGRF